MPVHIEEMPGGLVYPHPAGGASGASARSGIKIQMRNNRTLTANDVRYAQARAAFGEL